MLMASDAGNLRQVFAANNPIGELKKQQAYPPKAWYAVIARTGREQDAADGFRQQDVVAYWPNYTRQVPIGHRSGARRHRAVLAAIIPGMIFCPTADESLFWLAIQRIPYVLNMVRKTGGFPATLTNADIETIRRIEADENEPPPIKAQHAFKPGEQVKIIDGEMARWPCGKIERLLGDGRISVEVFLMGRMVPIKVLPHQIEVV